MAELVANPVKTVSPLERTDLSVDVGTKGGKGLPVVTAEGCPVSAQEEDLKVGWEMKMSQKTASFITQTNRRKTL